MFEYENITNNSSDKKISNADDILKYGWNKVGYPEVSLSKGGIPWSLENETQRSWNFHIHSWDMLDPLLNAHSHNQDKQYLLTSIVVAKDWIKENIDNSNSETVSPFAWYDMAVGLRSYRLAYILDAGRKYDLLDDIEDANLWDCLVIHQKYLSDDSKIKFHNNHGFFQAAGQLAMGRRFASISDEMQQAEEQGKNRLLMMLDTQFAEDGVHLEHSPDYHRMVYQTLKGLLDSGLIDDERIKSRSLKIEESLSWFILPNGILANLGDSDARLLTSTNEEAESAWNTDSMRYVVTEGKLGNLPKNKIALFHKGGYFVVRHNSQSNNHVQTSQLIQQACFHSRAHKQADTLSFIWYDKGHEILVDSGRYGYLGKTKQGSELWLQGHWYSDPKRIYCESTRAHNTLEFDSKDFPRKNIKPFGSATGRYLSDSSGVYVLESQANHLQNLHHRRILFFNPGKWLIVFDSYKDYLEEKHDARQWFHLAKELTVNHTKNGYKVQSSIDQTFEMNVLPLYKTKPIFQKSGAINLPLKPLNSNVMRGQTEPFYQGWWSGTERQFIPADSFSIDLNEANSGVFATLFTFGKAPKPLTKKTHIDEKKISGDLSWSDAEGKHCLSFCCHDSADLSIQYSIK